MQNFLRVGNMSSMCLRLACGLLSTLLLASELVAQESSRNDWNAAVNYWQAFGLMPDWTDEEKALRDTIPADLSMALPAKILGTVPHY